jgi:hypothetical protein
MHVTTGTLSGQQPPPQPLPHYKCMSRGVSHSVLGDYDDDDNDRVTPPSKLRIRFLYALRTISKHHNTFLDFISHFHSLFCIFAAH